jgi:hypothetical protein
LEEKQTPLFMILDLVFFVIFAEDGIQGISNYKTA